MSGSVALVYPMLAQVLLTFVLLLMMGKARVGAVQRGEVRVADIALGERVWPRPVQQISNNLQISSKRRSCSSCCAGSRFSLAPRAM